MHIGLKPSAIIEASARIARPAASRISYPNPCGHYALLHVWTGKLHIFIFWFGKYGAQCSHCEQVSAFTLSGSFACSLVVDRFPDATEPAVIFGAVTSKRIRRSVFKSVPELEIEIMAYLKHPKPITWIGAAGEILEKVARGGQASESVH